jgi:hypothetical protein
MPGRYVAGNSRRTAVRTVMHTRTLTLILAIAALAVLGIMAAQSTTTSQPVLAAVPNGTPVPVSYNLQGATPTPYNGCYTYTNNNSWTIPNWSSVVSSTFRSAYIPVPAIGWTTDMTVTANMTFPTTSSTYGLGMVLCEPERSCILASQSYPPPIAGTITIGFNDHSTNHLYNWSGSPDGIVFQPQTTDPISLGYYGWPYSPLVEPGGQRSQGRYALEVADLADSSQGATLNWWSLEICTSPIKPPTVTPTATPVPATPTPTQSPIEWRNCSTGEIYSTAGTFDWSEINYGIVTQTSNQICVQLLHGGHITAYAEAGGAGDNVSVGIGNSNLEYPPCPAETDDYVDLDPICQRHIKYLTCEWNILNTASVWSDASNTGPEICSEAWTGGELSMSVTEFTVTPGPSPTTIPTRTLTPTPTRMPTLTPCAPGGNANQWWIW